MNQVIGRLIQGDDLNGTAEEALQIAFELEHRRIERGQRSLPEEDRHVYITLRPKVPAGEAAEEVSGDDTVRASGKELPQLLLQACSVHRRQYTTR